MKTSNDSVKMIVRVRESCPDTQLRGYIGEVLSFHGHLARIKFRIAIGNKSDEALVDLDHLSPFNGKKP